jgi:hypothetical protein
MNGGIIGRWGKEVKGKDKGKAHGARGIEIRGRMIGLVETKKGGNGGIDIRFHSSPSCDKSTAGKYFTVGRPGGWGGMALSDPIPNCEPNTQAF